MKSRERGINTVEFALTLTCTLILLFSVMEIGRLFYTLNTAAEGVRRAARLATVCPPNDAKITEAALMTSSGSTTSPYLNGLSSSQISLQYLDASGSVTTDPNLMQYARVSINGYSQTLLIPFVSLTITVPSFPTTVPLENKGYIPALGASTCLSL